MATAAPTKPSTLGAVNRVLLIVLGLNLGVALFKLLCGYTVGSSSMVADGWHSVADGANNLVGLAGVFIASRPADSKHPYGHRKFETFTAILITIFLVLVAVDVLKGAYARLTGSGPAVTIEASLYAFTVMGATIAANLFTCWYEARAGRRLHSDILLADSAHTRSDVYVSGAVIASLVAAKLGWPLLDPIAAVIIALLIGKAAVEILTGASNVLCDARVVDPQAVGELVNAIPGVHGCHKIRSRGQTEDFALDLHILVRPDLTVAEMHALDHSIKEQLRVQFPGAQQIFLHVEPARDPEREDAAV